MRTQMPMMSACSVYARCKAAVTAGLTTSSAVSAQPATCNPTNLLAAICLLDDGMAGMRGCNPFTALCAVNASYSGPSVIGSLGLTKVPMCMSLNTTAPLPGGSAALSIIPTTTQANDLGKAICTEMPSMDGCK